MRTTSIAHPEARRMKNNHTSVWIVVMLVLTICSTALSDDVSATKIHPHDPKPGEPPILVVQVWLMGVLVRDGVDLDDGLDGETELIITGEVNYRGKDHPHTMLTLGDSQGGVKQGNPIVLNWDMDPDDSDWKAYNPPIFNQWEWSDEPAPPDTDGDGIPDYDHTADGGSTGYYYDLNWHVWLPEHRECSPFDGLDLHFDVVEDDYLSGPEQFAVGATLLGLTYITMAAGFSPLGAAAAATGAAIGAATTLGTSDDKNPTGEGGAPIGEDWDSPWKNEEGRGPGEDQVVHTYNGRTAWMGDIAIDYKIAVWEEPDTENECGPEPEAPSAPPVPTPEDIYAGYETIIDYGEYNQYNYQIYELLEKDENGNLIEGTDEDLYSGWEEVDSLNGSIDFVFDLWKRTLDEISIYEYEPGTDLANNSNIEQVRQSMLEATFASGIDPLVSEVVNIAALKEPVLYNTAYQTLLFARLLEESGYYYESLDNYSIAMKLALFIISDSGQEAIAAVLPDWLDSDGDGVADIADECPEEDASTEDANWDGCIDGRQDMIINIVDLNTGDSPSNLEISIYNEAGEEVWSGGGQGSVTLIEGDYTLEAKIGIFGTHLKLASQQFPVREGGTAEVNVQIHVFGLPIELVPVSAHVAAAYVIGSVFASLGAFMSNARDLGWSRSKTSRAGIAVGIASFILMGVA